LCWILINEKSDGNGNEEFLGERKERPFNCLKFDQSISGEELVFEIVIKECVTINLQKQKETDVRYSHTFYTRSLVAVVDIIRSSL
jgi:hypothetical protein